MWLHLGSEHGGARLLQSLLFRHCDRVAAQHAVSGAHQHAVECSLRDVEQMFLQVLVRMCFTMVGLQTNSLLIAVSRLFTHPSLIPVSCLKTSPLSVAVSRSQTNPLLIAVSRL